MVLSIGCARKSESSSLSKLYLIVQHFNSIRHAELTMLTSNQEIVFIIVIAFAWEFVLIVKDSNFVLVLLKVLLLLFHVLWLLLQDEFVIADVTFIIVNTSDTPYNIPPIMAIMTMVILRKTKSIMTMITIILITPSIIINKINKNNMPITGGGGCYDCKS